jgi:hypothetical protein
MRFGRRTAHTLRCRDVRRHTHRLAVEPHVDESGPRVRLEVDGAELLLDPLQVGRLRGDLRDSVLAAGEQFAADEQAST